MIATHLAEMEQPEAGLPELRRYFARLATIARTPAGLRGCLMCNTAVELAPHDPAIAAKVQGFLQRLEAVFAVVLAHAHQRGELAPIITPRDTARYLTGVVLGLNVYVKTSADREAIDAYIRIALTTIGAPPAMP